MDHARANFDNYGARVTEAGMRWGLSGWWDGNWSVDPAGVSEVLALDENGLANSWAKNYGGPPGTGFVRVYGGTWSAGGPTANLSAVQAVAEARGREERRGGSLPRASPFSWRLAPVRLSALAP